MINLVAYQYNMRVNKQKMGPMGFVCSDFQCLVTVLTLISHVKTLIESRIVKLSFSRIVHKNLFKVTRVKTENEFDSTV